MKDGPHIRLGWGRREAPLNAPVGFDGYSYGLTDKAGDKVTLSRPLPYGRPFKAGDVVGMYIKLPSERAPEDENDPANIKRERIPIRYKGQLYFESLEYPRTREMEQMMERSRKGNSIEDALKGIEGTGVFEPSDPQSSATAVAESANGVSSVVNGNGSSTATAANSGTSGGGGSAKVKNRKNPGTKEKPSGPTIPSLRPIPSLQGSKIGFFVNSEPQGIAFRDIFDYRPLRVKGFSGLKPAPSKSTTSSSRPGKQEPAKKGESTEPVINVKPRENVFDDGALGYFPFVSSYGGARAKLITGEDGFRFPPPDDIEAALESVSQPPSDSAAIKQESSAGGMGRRWKPLSARFEEHLSEMWAYDLQDEAKAQAVADKQAEEKAKRNNAAKERYAAAKKKHAAALARNATASPAPSQHAGGEGDQEEGDRTIVAGEQSGMDLDDDVKSGIVDGRNGVEDMPDQSAIEVMDVRNAEHAFEASLGEVNTPPETRPDAAQHSWSNSRDATPDEEIRLVQSAKVEEDVEMDDLRS
ncbi:Ash2-trithorax [Pseudozyma hubeiensis SY62]|uniref:Ash2-trithorax n=1 Tax=Pseudozyma hubeiensis (strain SY62) TaxID=1305764 RepID=R9P6C9_PSEHS|nr:Ash2-trithorax [Pseudozyma hubeiensis SY62]GAC96906.1 Ash2-trithorax [Pseudozyma hubeiensis SY62]